MGNAANVNASSAASRVAVDKIKYGILGVGIRFSLGTLGVANDGPGAGGPAFALPRFSSVRCRSSAAEDSTAGQTKPEYGRVPELCVGRAALCDVARCCLLGVARWARLVMAIERWKIEPKLSGNGSAASSVADSFS
jgi:hypothetical protein